MAETDAKPIPNSPTSTTFGAQEQTRTIKEFSRFDYRKMLLNIDRNLTESDICRLKYLCLDTNIGLRHGELETASRGLDLLDKLEKRGRLSKDNLGIMIEMLSLIERIDLKVQVEKCLPFAERGKKTNCISAYRRMVVDFAYDIGKNDLSSLKPLLRDHMAARKIEKIDEPIKLMIELEKLMIISPTNLDFLEEIGVYIGSNELVSKVTRYRGSSECGNVKEHSQSSSRSEPVVQEEEYQDVQETFNSLKLTEPPVKNQGSQQESYISYLASSLGYEWRMLGYKLGLSAVDMDGIEDSYTMLLKWQERTHPEQQMDSLCEALGSPKIDRQDLSNYLKNEMSSIQSISQPVEATPSLTKQAVQRDAVLDTQNTRGLQIEKYNMTHATRGICLIINNMQFTKILKERRGSEIDEDNLKHVFGYLGFYVDVMRNLTAAQMMNKIIDIRKMDHSKYDCFVCCILSHGDLGNVFGSDGETCKIIEMTSAFRTGHCKTLANKPKLFFLQACQGTRRAEQFVHNMETDDAPPTATENIPDDADFLLGYATAPGNVSYRSKTFGSWYITTLTQNLKKYHHTNHILDILTQVNSEVSKAIARESNGCYKQVPAPQYTLRKNLYFPKL
ncbi:caspase-8-like [Antedon mediterranea]|uniref:caspase-8-like n=1 Tax=Antedon mediterranea TaxID=105859 RepID=UPI003AF43449